MKVLPQPQSIRAENKDAWDGNKVDSNVRYQHFEISIREICSKGFRMIKKRDKR